LNLHRWYDETDFERKFSVALKQRFWLKPMDDPYGHFADTSRSDITFSVISVTKLKNKVELFFKGEKLLSWFVLNSSFFVFLIRSALTCRGFSLEWNLLKKSEGCGITSCLFFHSVNSRETYIFRLGRRGEKGI